MQKNKLARIILVLLFAFLEGCEVEKCVSFRDSDGRIVDAFVYKIEGGQSLSLNPLGALIGASKNGKICIRPSENFSIANDHFRIVGMGQYQDKVYENFEMIPSTVVLTPKSMKSMGSDSIDF